MYSAVSLLFLTVLLSIITIVEARLGTAILFTFSEVYVANYRLSYINVHLVTSHHCARFEYNVLVQGARSVVSTFLAEYKKIS
jgi:hypothetical protein